MPSQKFGERLRELRENSGLSQREVADKVGIDSTYLNKLESGSTVTVPPSGKVIDRLVKLLGADEAELTTLAANVPSRTKIPSKAGKALAFATCGIGILLSAGLLVFGLVSFLKRMPRDNEGFYPTWLLHADGHAAALLAKADNADIIGQQNGDALDTFKVKVSGKNPSDLVFIGIAKQSDIDSYLDGVAYEEITDLRIFPLFIVSTAVQNPAAKAKPVDPVSQSFWVRSAYGTGTQELVWELAPDRNSLVVINTNGFALSDTDVVFATRSPLSRLSGTGYFLAVLVLLPLSIFTFTLATRARNLGGFPQ